MNTKKIIYNKSFSWGEKSLK